MNPVAEKSRKVIFGAANLVLAAFNSAQLLTASACLVIVFFDTSGVYRGSPTELLSLLFMGAYFLLTLAGFLLPLVVGVGLLAGWCAGYALHLAAIVPGGLLFFPFGWAYIVLAFLYGRGELMTERLAPAR